MTRTDSIVVGTLVVLLALVAGLVGVPALQTTTARETPAPSSSVEVQPYREGVLGAPVSISPLTARSQVDRDLVALVFSGLVRNGPGGTLVPDLASSWSVDDAGKVWTFEIRDDATWQDGQPVTAEDVAFTIRTLQDPTYVGPAAGSWTEVVVRAVSQRTVTFTLMTPLGGFLQAATQPIAPAHILADVPVAALAEHPFGSQPIGSGPFALAELTDTSATLVPVSSTTSGVGPDVSGGTLDSLTTAAPSLRPDRPLPYLSGIKFTFYDDQAAMMAAYRAGELDTVTGLAPADAAELATEPASRLMRYPGATLTAALLNLRPSHPEFADAAVRTALLTGLDRTGLVEKVFAGSAAVATGPIPPGSPMFDPTADPAIPYDRGVARKALQAAGWTFKKGDGWFLPKATKPLAIEILSPDKKSNVTVWSAAKQVAADWRRLGFEVTHVGLPAGDFVDRLAKGSFQVAVTDVSVGLDPDLYPLLASTQTVTGASNIIGVQDPALDALLTKARTPGSTDARSAAYSALQVQLAKGRYLLPLAFQDEVVVVHDRLEGPAIRQVADASDRFWDVLTWRLAEDR